MKQGIFDYNSKPEGYFSNPREEMLRYVPDGIAKSLEFGCGEGGFSAYLKQKRGVEAWAVEIESSAAQKASSVLDKVINEDADTALDKLPDEYFDCVIFFDILEHLVNPYELLNKIKGKLKKNGCVICSIPNIRYYRVLKSYLFHADWKYKDQGVLDKTHLRFFTYKSILRLFSDLEYDIELIEGLHITSSKSYRILNFLFLNALRDCKYKHFVVVSKPK